jgi:molybdopterin-guanine dinucleotide biosynthesis protein A
MVSFDAVVLAGGAARRLGGADKPGLAVGGRSLLDRVLGACAGAGATVVVGPRRVTVRPVLWAREEPPGGGPLPALAAGLSVLASALRPSGPVVLLAADLPFLTAETVTALVRELLATTVDGVLLTDPTGRDQPLAAAYQAESLRRELALLATEHGSLANLPLRFLTAELTLHRLPDPTGDASFDCDTWPDLTRARARFPDDPES